jgi:protein-glucosylgalactosylhydroxylysine glucosidase
MNLGVLPPDEDAQPFVDNSIFTNIISSLAIFFANYTNCLTGSSAINSSWIDNARCLYLPYDKENKLNLEYENYKLGTEIKQADAVLISFPLLWKLDPEVRRNDLLYYENVTRQTGPAMTWSMHAIGHIELKEFERANDLFLRSYLIYAKEPFLVTSNS